MRRMLMVAVLVVSALIGPAELPAQDAVKLDPKLKALLHIAGKVQILGKEVLPGDIEAARNLGAGDREIHDTVLIAATLNISVICTPNWRSQAKSPTTRRFKTGS